MGSLPIVRVRASNTTLTSEHLIDLEEAEKLHQDLVEEEMICDHVRHTITRNQILYARACSD